MKRILGMAILAISFVLAVQAEETDAIEMAESETIAWLALTDSGQYALSWEVAGALFQNAVSRKEWERSLSAVRTPIGTLQSRKRASANYETTLPGAPDGQYVVFTFNAAFANKASALETVTAMRDSDGAWRVVGYFIK